MTEAQLARIRAALTEYTRKTTVSADAARAALVREGIYLENGKLSPNYGGELKVSG